MSPRLVGVDGVEVADALAVLGILAVGDVDAVLVDDRRRDHLVAGPRPDRVLRVGVELPELLAGERLVAAHPAVALRARPPDRRRRSCRPSGVDHWPWRMRSSTELSSHTSLPVFLLSAMIAGALRRRDVDVALVLAVRRAHEDQVAPDDRRRVRQVVRIGADLFHHVERPDRRRRRSGRSASRP